MLHLPDSNLIKNSFIQIEFEIQCGKLWTFSLQIIDINLLVTLKKTIFSRQYKILQIISNTSGLQEIVKSACWIFCDYNTHNLHANVWGRNGGRKAFGSFGARSSCKLRAVTMHSCRNIIETSACFLWKSGGRVAQQPC